MRGTTLTLALSILALVMTLNAYVGTRAMLAESDRRLTDINRGAAERHAEDCRLYYTVRMGGAC